MKTKFVVAVVPLMTIVAISVWEKQIFTFTERTVGNGRLALVFALVALGLIFWEIRRHHTKA